MRAAFVSVFAFGFTAFGTLSFADSATVEAAAWDAFGDLMHNGEPYTPATIGGGS